MAPTTPFEDTAGAEFTSLDAEHAFLQQIDNETAAALSEAGRSVQGRPLWRFDVGAGADETWMIVASHANERAAREAVLQFARDLAYSTDPVIVGYLQNRRLVCMPTPNPDGFTVPENDNANGVDINRDHWALSQPETRAIQRVMTESAPRLLLDLHEQGFDPSTNMLLRRPELEVLYEGVGTLGDDLVDDIRADLSGEGISNDLYPIPGRPSLREAAATRHVLAVLVESYINDDREDRVGWQLTALNTTLLWHGANTSGLVAVQAASREYQSTTVDQYELQTGTTNFPWPITLLPSDLVGYRLTGGVAPSAFAPYGVTVQQGTIVPLSQEARAVIPILLDAESDDTQASATRLTSIPTPGSRATVQEFAEILSGSHDMVAEAWVLDTFQVGDNPSGTLIPITSGEVTFDATAESFGTLTLTTEGTDERGDSLFPRRAGDLLAPYGNEVFVRRGVDIGSEVLWSPLGYFRINEDDQPTASDHPITLECRDRMSGIVDAELISPRQYGKSHTVQDVVADLVTDVYPQAVIVFDDDSGEDALGRQLVVEKDRYAALQDIADSLGKIVYWDGLGVLRFQDAPDLDTIVWEVKAGSDGVLVDSSRRVTREGMYNAVVARGEGGDTVTPVQQVAIDTGATSPTRWGGRFGKVPTFYSSPLLTTDGRALSAAQKLLRRYLGMPYEIDFNVVPNPALRPYDVVRIQQKSGDREKHVVDRVTIPLTAKPHMTGATRESTLVQVGQL